MDPRKRSTIDPRRHKVPSSHSSKVVSSLQDDETEENIRTFDMVS